MRRRLSGRSTTWPRIILGLLTAVVLAPLLFTASNFGVHALCCESPPPTSRFLGFWYEFQFIFVYAIIISGPFVLIGGGFFWLIAHKTKCNGLLSTAIFGILSGTLGFVLLTALVGLPLKDTLTPEMTEEERYQAFLTMPIDWLHAVLRYISLAISGAIIAYCVWCIGYLGRPPEENE